MGRRIWRCKLASADTAVRFTTPSGEEIGAHIDVNNLEGAVVFPRTTEAGFYRVLAENELAGSVAVNVDNRESNLDPLTMVQIKDLSKISKDRFFAAGINRLESLRQLREGVPIWHYLLVAALAFLALEQLAGLAWKR